MSWIILLFVQLHIQSLSDTVFTSLTMRMRNGYFSGQVYISTKFPLKSACSNITNVKPFQRAETNTLLKL